jgi:threonine synthase
MDKLSELSGTEIPKAVTELYDAPVRHTGCCTPESMEESVRAFLKIGRADE